MATGNYNNETSCARKIKQYAAGASARNLVADSPDGHTCPRTIIILGAGSFTSAKDGADVLISAPTPGTLGPFVAGQLIPAGYISELISASADILVLW